MSAAVCDCVFRKHRPYASRHYCFGVRLAGDTDPILAYTAEGEINQLRWSAAQPDWVAIAYDSSMQILRV